MFTFKFSALALQLYPVIYYLNFGHYDVVVLFRIH